MNFNYNFPNLVADPSYSFAPTGTRLPPFRPTPSGDDSSKTDAAAQRYDAELRRILGGETEALSAQEERVYRAEVSSPTIQHRANVA
jgi:hypothetical protein